MSEIADSMSVELFEVMKDANVDFDTRTIKIRCARCHKVMQGTSEDIKKALTFYHNDCILNLKRQIHMRIPIIKYELSITLWKRGDRIQPKTFIR